MRTPKYTTVLRRSVLLILAALLFSVLSLPAQAAPATAPSDHGLTSAATQSGVACSPVTATITAPYTQQGAVTVCLQIASIPTYILSWNTVELTVNGVSYTNMFAAATTLPAKINGYWYIKYTSSVPWGCLDVR
jgi:hypothetical protein